VANLKYIDDKKGKIRKYEKSRISAKVKQIFADSGQFNFETLGAVDFVFIDGCHSYEYVKNDTEKALKILNKKGIVIWHDYNIDWPGVYTYLNDLSRKLPIYKIRGTTLGFYQKTD